MRCGRDQEPGDWPQGLPTPKRARRLRKQRYGLAKAPLSGVAVGQPVKPVGEPGAANLQARFDEREVETEHGVRF